MQRIVPCPKASTPLRPLHDRDTSRQLEQRLAATLPPHTLMRRAGLAVARLAMAWQPHAQRIVVLAGGGNNGGDGLVAAARLAQDWPQRDVAVWWLGDPERLPDDARWAWQQARAANLTWLQAAPEHPPDLVIDALLGLGLDRPVQGTTLAALRWLQACPAPTLCVDLPSGLDPNTGHWWADTPAQPVAARATLSLLTLKPGLFTGLGRAAAGETIWFDDLGAQTDPTTAAAWLVTSAGWPDAAALRADHASHKGSRGDVLVLGGALPAAHAGVGMGGAALLAARAALRAGAGRVYVALVGEANQISPWDAGQPALMLRSAAAALDSDLPERATVVAGCGGGPGMATLLDTVLARSPRLVLDADALNALAGRADPGPLVQRRARRWWTVLTPHPLEAARLLRTDTASVQRDRLAAARTLAERWHAVVVLKGSGSVVAAPGLTPRVVASGSGWLATAGSGDTLAGLLGARLSALPWPAPPEDLLAAVADTVALHGTLPEHWRHRWPPTASDLLP